MGAKLLPAPPSSLSASSRCYSASKLPPSGSLTLYWYTRTPSTLLPQALLGHYMPLPEQHSPQNL
eukprot:1244613-Pyramimonas_sp.AAC.1